MSLWIKICGITTVEAIEAAAVAGAQALGFVFYEPSPRNLSPGEARALQAAVPQGLERVAVFLHPAQSLIDEVVAAVRPDWIQADLADLAALRLPAGQRVLPVLRSGDPLPAALPGRVLLEGRQSGAGERADWPAARMLAKRTELVLAGGLDAGNVEEAVTKVRPFGVDVSSGVEIRRGLKDPRMIRQFIEAARSAGDADAG